MKNIIKVMIVFCMIGTSCKKDTKNTTQSSKKLYTVKFNASNFVAQQGGITNGFIKADAISPYVIMLDSGVKKREIYASIGTSTVIQNEGDADFGTIITQLPAGTYPVFIIGGENDYPAISDVANRALTYDHTLQDFYYNVYSNGVNDLFFTKFNITVGSSDINQNVSLDRIVGKLDVVIQDQPPVAIKYILLTLSKSSFSYNINTGPVIGGAFEQKFYGGGGEVDLSTFILDTTTPFDVTITAIDANNVSAYSKKILNVSCPANKQVTLSGNLYGGSGTGGSVKIGADTTWNANSLTYHF